MKTTYSACLARLGLSQAGAAALHGVRIDTVKSWASGRNPVPQGAWDDLRSLSDQIEDAADELLERWQAAGSPPIEMNDTGAGDQALMTGAAFLLATSGPVQIGRTAATDAARHARRFGGE